MREALSGTIQDALWYPVSGNDRIAWSIIAFICLIGFLFQIRILLASKVDALGFGRLLVCIGQFLGITLFWMSGSIWYAFFFYATGCAFSSILMRVNWCHLEGSFRHRLKQASEVFFDFDQHHPVAQRSRHHHIGAD